MDIQKDLFFLRADYMVLQKLIVSLRKKIIELGKEQGEAVRQSTENFGHDDACQETIASDRILVVSRLNELEHIDRKAKILEPMPFSGKIRFGSLVKLSNGKIFRIGSYMVLAHHKEDNVSYNSSLGRKLLSKEKGDEIVHNNTIITILDVE